MADRFLLHCTQKNPRNWRLRCLERHPLDPGWEVGTYEKCHKDERPYHSKGDTIFDVVVKDQRPVIRSIFTVIDSNVVSGETVLYFNEYYYADNEPLELPGTYIQYRKMYLRTYMNKYQKENPLNYIKNNYTIYKKGEKPKSISKKDWDRILQMRKIERK